MSDEPKEISALPADQERIPGDGPGAEYVSPRGIAIVASLLGALAIALLLSLYLAWPRCDSTCLEEGRENVPEGGQTHDASSESGEMTTGLAPSIATTAETVPPREPATNAPQGSAVTPPPPTGTAPAAATANAAAEQTAASPNPIEITSVGPSSGPASGGTRVTISGSGFTDGAKVAFDGLPAKGVSVSSGGTVLHATSPCHPGGKADVAVTNPDLGSDSLPGAFEYTCACDSESKILLLVILAGALGGILHSLRSLFWYVGNRKLVRSWVLKYFVVPLNSAILACVFYLVIRAGFFDPKESTSCLAVLGIAVLVGLFSEEAIEKLKMIATAILTTKPQGSDPAPSPTPTAPAGNAAPQIEVKPSNGSVKGGETVTILGEGFSAITAVTFGGQPVRSFELIDSKTLRVVTPDAEMAGEVEVVVILEGGTTLRNAKGFTYKEP